MQSVFVRVWLNFKCVSQQSKLTHIMLATLHLHVHLYMYVCEIEVLMDVGRNAV